VCISSSILNECICQKLTHISGKDAQQNEILYSRYLKKGDVYVHADLHGAASVIIKNNPSTPDAPIPPSTLSQAGNLSVATSDAWESKAVMSAWWVNSDQVSKTAPTGEYLTTGGFMIRGKKNFLPPAQLILGFAVMFQISEGSKARHVKHRLVDQAASGNSTAESTTLQPAEDYQKEQAPEGASESDSDEDFPDAKLESASDNSDTESEPGDHKNPLQSTGGIQSAQNEQDQDSEDEVEDVADTTTGGPQHTELGISKAEPPSDEEEKEAPSVASSAQTQSKSGPRHLSARERRLLRKDQTPGLTLIAPGPPSTRGPATDDEETPSEVDDAASLTANTRETPAPSSSNPPSRTNKGPLPRGKRNKAKKLATKYADQDDEDRALALRLLGSKAGHEAAEAQAQAKKSKEEEAMAQKQRRREQHLRAQALGRATEEARRAALEGEPADAEDVVDEEAARLELVGLDSFTGRPLTGDELLAAVPVCAPWSALATYKYKVKLQPGVTKKGKAVKDILSRWDAAGKDPRAVDKKSEDSERIWPREIELVRGWKEAEIYGIVPVGKVRVMMAGGGGGGGGGGSSATKGKGKSSRGGRGSKR
jgi:NFACT protein C-terminal domain/NFACT protein RNA binding domain